MSWNKPSRLRRTGVAIAALAALAACDNRAGAVIESPDYGTAVTSNSVAQITGGASGAFLVNLSNRFNAEVPTTVNFDFNRSTLDGTSRAILIQQADWLRANPGVRLRVAGHTDRVGGESFNNRLGLRRARAVVAFLVSRGIDGERLDAVDTFGESQPVVPTEGRERRNRRAVTSVAGFSTSFAGGDFDGKRAAEIYQAYVSGEAQSLGDTGGGGGGGGSETAGE